MRGLQRGPELRVRQYPVRVDVVRRHARPCCWGRGKDRRGISLVLVIVICLILAICVPLAVSCCFLAGTFGSCSKHKKTPSSPRPARPTRSRVHTCMPGREKDPAAAGGWQPADKGPLSHVTVKGLIVSGQFGFDMRALWNTAGP